MRALIHSGLAALLVLAPALCCCNARLLAGFAASHAPASPEVAVPTSVPQSCCSHTAKPAEHSCCHEAAGEHAPAPQPPADPAGGKCCCERPDTTTPPAAPAPPAPRAAGELVPVELLGVAAVAPEHLGLAGGLDPPPGAGVDARSESLFARHVLRC